MRNPKKIPTGHKLNQVVKCESSLLEGKENTQLYCDEEDDVRK